MKFLDILSSDGNETYGKCSSSIAQGVSPKRAGEGPSRESLLLLVFPRFVLTPACCCVCFSPGFYSREHAVACMFPLSTQDPTSSLPCACLQYDRGAENNGFGSTHC